MVRVCLDDAEVLQASMTVLRKTSVVFEELPLSHAVWPVSAGGGENVCPIPTTRVGFDCMGHAVKVMGLGAHEHVHHRSMFDKLVEEESSRGLLPFSFVSSQGRRTASGTLRSQKKGASCLHNAQANFSLHCILSAGTHLKNLRLLPEKCNPEQDFGCTREDTRKAAEIPEGMAELGPEVWSSLKG